MSTRFSFDQPMDIDEFKSLSLKAFDDYEKKTKEIPKKIKELKKKRDESITTEYDVIDSIIYKKANKIVVGKIILTILLTVVAYLLVPFLVALIWNAIEPINDFSGLLYTIAGLLFEPALFALWWLWLMFFSDSTVWKWIVGVILFVGVITWWAAICSLIIWFSLNKIDTGRVAESLEKKKNFKEKISKAKKHDEFANNLKNKEIDAEIARLEREANKEGEYEWLYREWVNAFENDEKYQYWVDWADRVVTGGYGGRNNLHYRNCINDGPEKSLPMFRRKEGGYWGIVYNNNETPRRFIEITVDVAARSAKIWYEGSLRYKTNHL